MHTYMIYLYIYVDHNKTLSTIFKVQLNDKTFKTLLVETET